MEAENRKVTVMEADTYISFYLKANRIHVYVDALRGIGSPKFVCFMIDESGEILLMKPYPRKDFYSHRVKSGVYSGDNRLELNSKALCSIISRLYKWDNEYSYRVPGVIRPGQKIVMFHLPLAEEIEHDDFFPRPGRS